MLGRGYSRRAKVCSTWSPGGRLPRGPHEGSMPTIHGNTTGLGAHATRALERIYRRKVPLQHVATPELVKSLAEASHETGRQVAALVHRSGEVDYVIVGDATKLMLPDIGRLRTAEGRFRALRLVHTHLWNEPLTRDDLVDLVRLRLDLIAAIQLTPEGEPKSIHYAYNTPVFQEKSAAAAGTLSLGAPDPRLRDKDTLPYRQVGPVLLGREDVNFGELIRSLEDEFATRSRLHAVGAKDGRAILVHVAEKGKAGALSQAEESMRELA